MKKEKRFTALLLAMLCLLVSGCQQNTEKPDNIVTVESSREEPNYSQIEQDNKDTASAGPLENSSGDTPASSFQQEEENSADSTEENSPTESSDAENPSDYKDNFSVPTEDVQAFAQTIQQVVADKDLEALADLMAFPNYIGFSDQGEFIKTKEDFLALGKDKIFTDALMSEIAQADTSELSPSQAGFSLSSSGRPNIIFGVSDGNLAIVGMNY